MRGAVGTLAIATFLCNETQPQCDAFAERASLTLRVWFLDEATRMTPGTTVNFGFGDFIGWSQVAQLLDAVALLDYLSPSGWGAEQQQGFLWWVRDFLEYMNSPLADGCGSASGCGTGERAMVNNHGSW